MEVSVFPSLTQYVVKLTLAAGVAGAGLLGGAGVAVAEPAGDGPTTQVVGGEPVPEGSLPFLAAVLSKGTGSAQHRRSCTGSLIAAEWVLTAAHCASSAAAVTVGRTILSSDEGKLLDVVEVIIHPDHSFDVSRLDYDVALLRLSEKSHYTPATIAHPGTNDLEADGTLLEVAGWGATDRRGSRYPDQLHSATVPVWADDRCPYNRLGTEDGTNWVCAGGGRTDTCFGDSGGPLFGTDAAGRFVLVGTTSHGPYPCASQGEPGWYIDLNDRETFTWINRTVRPAVRVGR